MHHWCVLICWCDPDIDLDMLDYYLLMLLMDAMQIGHNFEKDLY